LMMIVPQHNLPPVCKIVLREMLSDRTGGCLPHMGEIIQRLAGFKLRRLADQPARCSDPGHTGHG
jgi:hypothetical protein